MNIADVISVIRDIATLLALLIGAALGVFVFFQLAPVLHLRILPNWTDETKQFLLIRFEVENKSRVRAHRPRGRIQVLEHPIQRGMFLSHFVPFDQSAIIASEQPIEWREPVKIFQTTKQIYPGEVIAIERLYACPKNEVIIHIGLQVEPGLGLVGRLVTRKREPWRQTTTCIVVKQSIEQRGG